MSEFIVKSIGEMQTVNDGTTKLVGAELGIGPSASRSSTSRPDSPITTTPIPRWRRSTSC